MDLPSDARIYPEPVISADGRWVAYASRADVGGGNGDGSDELWVLDLGTGQRTQLTHEVPSTTPGSSIASIAMNHDGSQVAYTRRVGPASSNEYSVRLLRRSTASEAEVGTSNSAPIALSGNSRRLAYTNRQGLVVRNNVTGVAKVIASGNAYPVLGTFDELGKRLVFWASDDPVGANPGRTSQVFLRQFGTTGSTTQLTHSAFAYTSPPVISGDGSTVAYIAHDQASAGSPAHPDVFRYRAATGRTRQVTSTAVITVDPRSRPAVSHDGSIIVFSSYDDIGGLEVQGEDLIRYHATTGEFTNLTRVPDEVDAVHPSMDGSANRVVFFAGSRFDPVLAGIECSSPVPRPTVSGVVTDERSGVPVVGAWVMAVSASGRLAAGAVTSTTGRYTLAVPPGSYRIETIDPSGRHRGEWHDDHGLDGYATAQVVTPALNASTRVDVDLAPAGSSASIAGRVTSAETGSGLEDAVVLVLDALDRVVEGTRTSKDGSYRVEGLPGGELRVAVVEPSGAFTPWLDIGSDTHPSVPVVTVPGETVTIDAPLAPRSVPPFERRVTGVVSDADGPIDLGTYVLVFDADDRFVRAAPVGAATRGRYFVDLPSGSFRFLFVDSHGLHAGEWYDDHGIGDIGVADVITIPPTPASVDMTMGPAGRSGQISGTVTDGRDGAPLLGVWVAVMDAATGSPVSSGLTGVDGGYAAGSLPAGQYVVAFIDPTGEHDFEFHAGTTLFPSAARVEVLAGATTSVDAVLDPRA